MRRSEGSGILNRRWGRSLGMRYSIRCSSDIGGYMKIRLGIPAPAKAEQLDDAAMPRARPANHAGSSHTLGKAWEVAKGRTASHPVDAVFSVERGG